MKTVTGADKQVISMIRGYGYKMTKDKMGIYFTNADNKFSFIETGEILNCYHNKLVEGKYELQDQLQSQILLQPCLQWVLRKIMQESKGDKN